MITPSMKLADLIELNYRLLDVMSRLGVGLGFGEHTIADACRNCGISESSFLLICNEYACNGYVPSGELLASASVADIMKYLHNSHIHYMDSEMETLRLSFPYVEALLAGKSGNGYSIAQFEENHSNIDEKLNDLKNIVMKYLPDVCDPLLRNRVLYHIFCLEEDLHHHTLIEDNVLVPMVDLMEKGAAASAAGKDCPMCGRQPVTAGSRQS